VPALYQGCSCHLTRILDVELPPGQEKGGREKKKEGKRRKKAHAVSSVGVHIEEGEKKGKREKRAGSDFTLLLLIPVIGGRGRERKKGKCVAPRGITL